MKTITTIALALSSLVIVSAAQAQERQITVSSAPANIELPASQLRGSTTAGTDAAGDTTAVRKVRIIMPSPYGN
ncbi:hypothetical protein [Methylorubrum sp. SB2]|uniref:hypothetical protein n=1 Tax=Methylorubrum subtropicum TaxID=3138812 RepID=UPI00313B818E